ncbi:MAG: UPF0149 family protein [Candidatus Delongbacteria bacterium]|jgi:yecA family protein|nr:UPF0149 family protein [Candidatus Delongbacteria bacterium]
MSARYIERYEELEDILEIENITHINADFVNGYLTAITCAPNTIEWDTWFEDLFEKSKGKKFEWDEPIKKDVIQDLLLEISDDITDGFLDDYYIPLIKRNEKNIIPEMTETWFKGFKRGMVLWDMDMMDNNPELTDAITLFMLYNAKDDILEDFLKKDGMTKKELSDVKNIQEEIKEKDARLFLGMGMRDVFYNSKLRISSKYPDLNIVLNKILKYDIKPEFVHGFISAIICSPDMIPPSVWLEKLWVGQKEHIYDSEQDASFVFKTLIDLNIEIDYGAQHLEMYPQLTDSKDISEAVEPWAEGFVRGLEVWKDRAEMKKRFITEYKIMNYYAQRMDVSDDYQVICTG